MVLTEQQKSTQWNYKQTEEIEEPLSWNSSYLLLFKLCSLMITLNHIPYNCTILSKLSLISKATFAECCCFSPLQVKSATMAGSLLAAYMTFKRHIHV